MLHASTQVPEETELARHIRQLSVEQWGERRATALIGRHESMLAAQEKLLRFAQAEGPVLIGGETGTGKELFARALYLLGNRRRRPFISVNCAQYADGQLIASELFGHRRGAFTGAVSDHRGVFEEADGGVVFLDEVGELTVTAQAMLLRVLGEGEVVPVGDTRARPVNVRVLAASNRDLQEMVNAGRFRADLLYRLRFLHLRVPALRDRGDDWELLSQHYLRRMGQDAGEHKRLSPGAIARLADYPWPGNVRELRGLMECSWCLARGGVIEPDAFDEHLQPGADAAFAGAAWAGAAPGGGVTAMEAGFAAIPLVRTAGDRSLVNDTVSRMHVGETTFWSAVYEPFMDRELNRHEVRSIVAEGLKRSNWSYKRALEVFGVSPEEYLKFMDFLRHHRLKPVR